VPAITIGGRRGAALELASPVLVAAGCFGRGVRQQQPWLRGVGALVTHTITPEPRGRGAFPLVREASAGLLYATGWPNHGFVRELADGVAAWAALVSPVIVSLAAGDARMLAEMAAELDGASAAAAIELPFDQAGAAAEPAEISRHVAAVTAVTALPVIAKLAPVPAPLAAAHAAFAAGADAVCVAQGWPAAWPGATSEALLLAGPAIAPLTLRLVTELAQAGLTPLIGCGGVDSVSAARACLAAGACAVQIGSALFREPALAVRVATELAAEEVPERSGDPAGQP